MTNFPYNNTVPGANNDPSVDQPDMLENFQSIGGPAPTTSGIIGVDHVGFNATDGGTHKQVTYSSNNNPGVQTNPASTAFTRQGTTTVSAENLFRNSLGTFPLSAIKGFARFLTASSGATVPVVMGFNAGVLVGRNVVGSTATYTITFTSGSIIANKAAVFLTFSDYRAITTDQYNYSISGDQVFLNVLTTVSNPSPYIVSIAILQF